MPWYRLYVRDRTGHFTGVREFEAIDEAHAIERIERMCRGLSCELWHDQSLLRQWNDELSNPFAGTVHRPQAN